MAFIVFHRFCRPWKLVIIEIANFWSKITVISKGLYFGVHFIQIEKKPQLDLTVPNDMTVRHVKNHWFLWFGPCRGNAKCVVSGRTISERMQGIRTSEFLEKNYKIFSIIIISIKLCLFRVHSFQNVYIKTDTKL